MAGVVNRQASDAHTIAVLRCCITSVSVECRSPPVAGSLTEFRAIPEDAGIATLADALRNEDSFGLGTGGSESGGARPNKR